MYIHASTFAEHLQHIPSDKFFEIAARTRRIGALLFSSPARVSANIGAALGAGGLKFKPFSRTALILTLLKAKNNYGLGLLEEINRMPGIATMKTGALYLLLHSLVERGWICIDREEKKKGTPPRTYYRLTPQGEEQADRLLGLLRSLKGEF